LHSILEVSIDWQDFLQHSDDVQSFSVLGIPCHDLCRLMHFGSPSIKLIASQCLLELLTRISDQRSCNNAELRCSVGYLKSIIAVTEGLVFSEDSKVAGNCSACLSVILGWEKFGSQEKVAVRESKWFRLIMEEFVVALTAPGLTSKSFSSQQKFAANMAVSLLRLSQVPDWLTSLFDGHLISGIVANLSARNVTAEIINLFSELMARKYLSQEHIVDLHNLLQVCASLFVVLHHGIVQSYLLVQIVLHEQVHVLVHLLNSPAVVYLILSHNIHTYQYVMRRCAEARSTREAPKHRCQSKGLKKSREAPMTCSHLSLA
jgi:hypothetical protein